MAVRQASAATGKAKKPRIQCVMSEALLTKLEAYAQEKEWSVSKAAEYIIHEWFDSAEAVPVTKPVEAETPSTNTDLEEMGEMMRLMKLLKAAREIGLM